MADVFRSMQGILGGMQLNLVTSTPSFDQIGNMNTASMEANSEKTMDDWSAPVDPDDCF